MHPNAEHVQSAILARGVGCQVVELPDSTRSAADAAEAIGCTLGQIVKSLLFLAGADAVLVLTSGTNRVSLEKLAALLGGPLARADADTVKRLTGFAIGGVAPIGAAQPLRVLIDRDLDRHQILWAAAGTPHAVFRCTPQELVHLSGGAWADVADSQATEK